MESNEHSTQLLNLSLYDLEYALDLISTEENTGHDKEIFIASLIGFVSLGIFILSCTLGLAILWADNTLGWTLITTSFIAAIVFIIYSIYSTKIVDIFEGTKISLEQLQRKNLGDVAEQKWEKESKNSNALLGCIVILFIPICAWGVVELTLGIIHKEVNTTAITLISIPSIFIWVVSAINSFRKYSLYTKLLGLANKFQKAKQEPVEQEFNAVNISLDEAGLLSQIEAKKIRRSIAQAESNIQRLFAITIGQDASAFLKKLKEQMSDSYSDIRNAIDAMQEEPLPSTSVALFGQPGFYQIKISGYRIIYIIDNEKQRIEIYQIQKSGIQEASHGS